MRLPNAVIAKPSRLIGPYWASHEGCVKIPAPMIVPVTSAVAGHSVRPFGLSVTSCVVWLMSAPPASSRLLIAQVAQ